MNIFIITSVIKVSDNHSVQSFCHHPRRQHETLKTIYSIREKNPEAKIFLLECSDMSKEQEHFLREKVDIFLNFFTEEGWNLDRVEKMNFKHFQLYYP